jgi:uncharacterized protein YbjT (DUF2867 family)
MSKKRPMILVTGATGTTGREVVKQLSARGTAIRALVRPRASASTLDLPGVEIALGDLEDPTSLDAALAGIQRAFLLTPSSPRKVEQEANFIAAARRAGIQHVVKLSIVGAALNSPARILRWHAEAEELLRGSGLAFTLLRPSYFMQNLLWSAPDITAHGVFNSSLSGSVRHSHIDARDIAAVAAAVLTGPGHDGQAYHLTGPEALTYPEIAAILSRVTGKPIMYDSSRENYAKFLMRFGLDVDDVLELDACLARDEAGAAVTPLVSTIAHKRPISAEQFARDHAHVFRNA